MYNIYKTKQNVIAFTFLNCLETCIISYMKRVASPGLIHDTGCLGLVYWDNPEGWYREGGGFRMGNTCISVDNGFVIKGIVYILCCH